jgi:uncharacterized damage-inducible protein DinB
VFDCVSSVTAKEFTRDLGNSYPSMRDTLTHIVWAEWIWLQRWKGTSPQHFFDATEFPDFNTLKARWLELEAEQRAFVGAVTAERLGAVVTYVNSQGQTWRYPLWRQMYHVVNPFDVSPWSAHDHAASVGNGAGRDGLSGVPR